MRARVGATISSLLHVTGVARVPYWVSDTHLQASINELMSETSRDYSQNVDSGSPTVELGCVFDTIFWSLNECDSAFSGILPRSTDPESIVRLLNTIFSTSDSYTVSESNDPPCVSAIEVWLIRPVWFVPRASDVEAALSCVSSVLESLPDVPVEADDVSAWTEGLWWMVDLMRLLHQEPCQFLLASTPEETTIDSYVLEEGSVSSYLFPEVAREGHWNDVVEALKLGVKSDSVEFRFLTHRNPEVTFIHLMDLIEYVVSSLPIFDQTMFWKTFILNHDYNEVARASVSSRASVLKHHSGFYVRRRIEAFCRNDRDCGTNHRALIDSIAEIDALSGNDYVADCLPWDEEYLDELKLTLRDINMHLDDLSGADMSHRQLISDGLFADQNPDTVTEYVYCIAHIDTARHAAAKAFERRSTQKDLRIFVQLVWLANLGYSAVIRFVKH